MKRIFGQTPDRVLGRVIGRKLLILLREVLHLFSIGLHQLDRGARPVPVDDPAPAYTQEIVEEYARVFTGWNFANTDQWVSADGWVSRTQRWMVCFQGLRILPSGIWGYLTFDVWKV